MITIVLEEQAELKRLGELYIDDDICFGAEFRDNEGEVIKIPMTQDNARVLGAVLFKKVKLSILVEPLPE